MSQVYFNHTTKLEVVKKGYAPAATIALQRVGDSFQYGVAICSRYDNFSRKYGREVALQRLEKGFRVTVIPKDLIEFGIVNGEKDMCIAFLYQLAMSISTKSRQWKNKVTKFNLVQKELAFQEASQAKVIKLPETGTIAYHTFPNTENH